MDDGSSTCNGGSGFGTSGSGSIWVNIFNEAGEPEWINDIEIQTASTTCAGSTQRIVVTGRASVTSGVETGPENNLWVVARFCHDGTLDTSFGGDVRYWDIEETSDAAGTVTIVVGDNDAAQEDWTRDSEPFALAIEPTTNKIVVGGYAMLPKDGQDIETEPWFSFFALARLEEDGDFDTFGPNDQDPGVIRFDGDGHVDADRVDNQVRGLQLVEDQDDEDQYDIIIAGPDRLATENHRNFLVARVDYTGAYPVWDDDWSGPTIIDIVSGQDDIAYDVVVRENPGDVIIGGSTCTTSCAGTSPSSDFALARVDLSDGATDSGFNGTGKRVYDSGAYTDIGYSLVLQSQSEGNPKLVIGGYSTTSTGTPYMSGARFLYTGDDTTPNKFRSNFSSSSGNGDQAWELQVQTNRRIVAGGVHTVSPTPYFAIIRMCKEPNETTCVNPEPPGYDGGHESDMSEAPLATIFLNQPLHITSGRRIDDFSILKAAEQRLAPKAVDAELSKQWWIASVFQAVWHVDAEIDPILILPVQARMVLPKSVEDYIELFRS